ncbi:MAG: zf-HC2 domain-containing protein [Methylococcales bacterium]
MKSCKAITELLSESMERPLTWREALAVRMHFFMCQSCPRFQQQVQFLRKAASRYYPNEHDKNPVGHNINRGQ